MKKKKKLWSFAAGALLLASLSFGTGASAMHDPGGIGGSPLPPKCIPGKPCPIGN